MFNASGNSFITTSVQTEVNTCTPVLLHEDTKLNRLEVCQQSVEDNFEAFIHNVSEDPESLSQATKPHSTPATLLWLDKNYQLADGICIPRNTLYSHYVHFCHINSMTPLNSASFGKIIRQVFPSLTTRRLGTRGQSRYHYYGIAIKETSPYYDTNCSRISFSSSDKRINSRIGSLVSTRNQATSTVLPQFPTLKEITLPSHVCQDKVNSFILMYHVHCQRVFDAIIRGTLDDVYQYLEHFWHGVPPHISILLDTNTIINMVGVCDSILYRTICTVFMPSVLKDCSENLIHMIRTFADKLEEWILSALEGLPSNLRTVKLRLSKNFCLTMRRQVALYQLTRTAQVVIANFDMMDNIKRDWKKINMAPISQQVLVFTQIPDDHIKTVHRICEYWDNFSCLLELQGNIEDFTNKVENVVDSCVGVHLQPEKIPIRKTAKSFVLLWHAIGTLISRDMTIHSAESFGSFHLIQTMFDEYMHYLIEILHSKYITQYLLDNLPLDMLPDFEPCGTYEPAGTDDKSITKLPSIPDANLEVSLPEDANILRNTSFSPTTNFDLFCSHVTIDRTDYVSKGLSSTSNFPELRDVSNEQKFATTMYNETSVTSQFNTIDQDTSVDYSNAVFFQESLNFSCTTEYYPTEPQSHQHQTDLQ